jgi:hypothetical protein
MLARCTSKDRTNPLGSSDGRAQPAPNFGFGVAPRQDLRDQGASQPQAIFSMIRSGNPSSADSCGKEQPDDRRRDLLDLSLLGDIGRSRQCALV